MAEIRVERKSGGKTWLWVLLAILALVAVVVLLDYLGYIELPFRMGAAELRTMVPALASGVVGTIEEV